MELCGAVMYCCLGAWCLLAKGEWRGFSGRRRDHRDAGTQRQQRRRDAGTTEKLETTETTETQRPQRKMMPDFVVVSLVSLVPVVSSIPVVSFVSFVSFVPFVPFVSPLSSLLSPIPSQPHNTPTPPPCYDVMALWRYDLVIPRRATSVNSLDINVIQSLKLN